MRIVRELAGYGLASTVALAADAGLLYYLVTYCHFRVVPAATLSFSTGAVVAYVIAVKLAFSAHRLDSRRTEFIVFCLLGLVGLLVNTCIVAAGTYLGFDLMLTKICAAGATFTCNFWLRRQVLFVDPATARETATHVFAE